MTLSNVNGPDDRLESLSGRVREFIDASLSEATKKAYSADWSAFVAWTKKMNLTALPASPTTVALYLAEKSTTHKTTSMSRFLVVIGKLHTWANFPNPVSTEEVKTVFRGVKRTLGARRQKAEPITWPMMKSLIAKCTPSIIGTRDSALLSLGWAGALRRSEITELTIDDVNIGDEGITVRINRSKTDQEAIGVEIGIPRNKSDTRFCPVELLERWISRMEISEGPLFFALRRNSGDLMFQKISGRNHLSPLVINNVVKKYVRMIGLNPRLYSSHSLRRGLATEAGRLNVPERIVMRHTRHRSVDVLRGYIDSGSLFEENPLAAVWLNQ